MSSMDYSKLSDRQIVDGILNNNKSVLEYFFTKKCSPLLSYILQNVFDGNIDKRELVSELYLFMAQNDWQVFRKFQFRSSLMTYVSVVSVRFFIAKRAQLIDSPLSTSLNNQAGQIHSTALTLEQRIDIREALKKMPNERYRKVIEILDLQDVRPELLAEEMNVTVDNLYNIHRRALVQLRLVMGRKEDWV
ncbi:sigma-70 family RNA polymerase sigma factor [Pseudoprevotella muciniphila]|uniref:Sigma-70 family RNA polymerase sigma factor n=1 Tax=Pseudoprevotella muciniphila TaxID=2133944 RepID=A0A5P8E773_9BACT|nr:sigma-70 family RNA polymerase sigma factor [Pseudoprevotella muciniphila]QFQ12813.1 sigma-70 family RNA polymerase sigma factor [Pseudoprevotella muciniphila]